jgi:UDP-2,3-diacylglucosamine pyrophosphatase LpxH
MKKIEALYISDVHLGSKGCKAKELLDVLKEYEPETVYIVGDFIDGWLLKKRHYWPQEHTNLVRKILSYTKRGARVYYITGNHDDFLRAYGELDFGNIKIVEEMIVDRTWIVHGDKYDGIVMYNKWVAVLGSIGYEFVIFVSEVIKKLRKKLGLRPRSLSKWIKSKVKGAASFLDSFEKTLIEQAKVRHCDTVICGHIHTPCDRRINGVRYINTGDWIESCSYLTQEKGKLTLHHL